NGPNSLALDAHGNLFVANEAAGTVSVFALAYDANGNLLPSSTSPYTALSGGDNPRVLAFDPHANLFDADYAATFDTTVNLFALAYDGQGRVLPSSTSPQAALGGLDQPSALAFDAHGNLFVANAGMEYDGTTVSVFALAYDGSGNILPGG